MGSYGAQMCREPKERLAKGTNNTLQCELKKKITKNSSQGVSQCNRKFHQISDF